jgi:hypothetical protein
VWLGLSGRCGVLRAGVLLEVAHWLAS